jgi:SOS-response transcriptional repressors (RecA-mediated autopeptidases)
MWKGELYMDINKYIGNKIRNLREQRNLTQEEIAEYLNTTPQTISRYEIGDRKTNQDILFKLAEYFKVSINDFFPPLSFDNASIADISSDNTIQIPVLGSIKAGTPIEAQEDILEYVDIPTEWTKGGKLYYGLKISGDSMYPKYNENDIVIFEHIEDFVSAQKKDCAVMVNGFDATFKNVTITENGITLVPLNINNSDNYQPTFYDNEQINSLPVKIVGIAREKRTRL